MRTEVSANKDYKYYNMSSLFVIDSLWWYQQSTALSTAMVMVTAFPKVHFRRLSASDLSKPRQLLTAAHATRDPYTLTLQARSQPC